MISLPYWRERERQEAGVEDMVWGSGGGGQYNFLFIFIFKAEKNKCYTGRGEEEEKEEEEKRIRDPTSLNNLASSSSLSMLDTEP